MHSGAASGSGEPVYVGANIYHWGLREQDNLLRIGVREWVTSVADLGLASTAWFCRYNARGPHVFALFKTTRQNAGATKSFVAANINKFLREQPSCVDLTHETLARLHAGCRNRTMSIADARDGYGRNNSFVVFEHSDKRYPLTVGAAFCDRERLWNDMCALSEWALATGDQPANSRAVQVLGTLDALVSNGIESAGSFWAYYVGSLIVSVDTWQERVRKVRPKLARLLPESVREGLAGVWETPVSPTLAKTIGSLLATVQGTEKDESRYAIIREVIHLALSQIGVPGRIEIPLVLYAWRRHLEN